MPASVMWRTTRRRNSRLWRTLFGALGATARTLFAYSLSAAKLSFPPTK